MAKKILVTVSSIILVFISLCNLEVMVKTWDYSLQSIYAVDWGYEMGQTKTIWESHLMPMVLNYCLIFALCAVVAVVAIIFRKDIFSYITAAANLVVMLPYLVIGKSYSYGTGYYLSVRYDDSLAYYIFPFFDPEFRMDIVYIAIPIIGAILSFIAIYLIKRNKKEAV